ncbi:MAG: LysM peptidoglycan-binding domain-containing protein [Micropruina sp.]|nr:LysM peptidoglycan-binding domain-containing protein [Micropruina sp.]
MAAYVQRQSLQTANGSMVGAGGGPTTNIREDVLPVMDRLHMLWSMSNGDYDAEYPTVVGKPAKSSLPPAAIPRTIAALKTNESGQIDPAVCRQFLRTSIADGVGKGRKNFAFDVHSVQDALLANQLLAPADHLAERKPPPMFRVTLNEADLPKTIAAIARMKKSAAAGTFRRDLFAGTAPISAATQSDVNLILHPGTTVVPGVGGAPPTIKMPPKMTGTGVGGKYEKAMVGAMRKFLQPMADRFNKLKKKPPAFPIGGANDIAVLAQQECERYFGAHSGGASRAAGGKYHPGAYNLSAKLGDQSTRPISKADRDGWVNYFMTTKGYGGQEAMKKFNCHPDLRPAPDGTEFARVLDQFGKDNTALVDDAIHSWPAEAGTGTVFIQPYGESNPKKIREQRWEVFTTLIHEFMHILEHPEFGKAASTVGGNGERILFEGFAELMRYDLWTGPGQLKARLGSPELAPLREKVEGGKYPYDASVVVDAAAYSERADAEAIAAKVGMGNAKAAFLLGHVEKIGLGSWKATDAGEAESYVVAAGETEASIRAKTGAKTVLDSGGKPLPVGGALAAGTTVKIPGIRWIVAIEGDTLTTVSRQHDVTTSALAVANGLASGTSPAHKFTVGARLLIPVHAPVSP